MSAKAGRPELAPGLSVQEFRRHYWYLADLAAFCRRHGLGADGSKQALIERVEAYLASGAPPRAKAGKTASRQAPSRREGPLAVDTPVGDDFKSDAETRAFFKSVIGERFHFTAHLQQFRRARRARGEPLTYGDLVREWLDEEVRRKDKSYKSAIAGTWQYNQFVRDFMADKARNAGRGIGEAAKAWATVRDQPGPHTYAQFKRLGTKD